MRQTAAMPDPLDDRPFAWTRRGEDVHVTRRGRPAVVLRRAAAVRFVERVERLDEAGALQLMARVTGNFKRGNERG
jgi:hypothetical protein